ncbi:MAG: polysaccharide export protein [Gammaproteobacteria bacterium]|nr:polysaccharide export protein [Gammaproteobacteria bacterium]
MRKLVVLILASLVAYAISMPVLSDSLSDYRLGSGDSIKISVYEEPELGLEVRLSDAATISYPFLGEIQVSGLTVGNLEDKITDGLKGDYLVSPSVSVSVVEYRQFYIHGEVEAPGGFPYVPGLTLRKAIALAGGFTERASRSKMYVIQDGIVNTSERSRQIDLDERLSPGDIVTIEQSFF